MFLFFIAVAILVLLLCSIYCVMCKYLPGCVVVLGNYSQSEVQKNNLVRYISSKNQKLYSCFLVVEFLCRVAVAGLAGLQALAAVDRRQDSAECKTPAVRTLAAVGIVAAGVAAWDRHNCHIAAASGFRTRIAVVAVVGSCWAFAGSEILRPCPCFHPYYYPYYHPCCPYRSYHPYYPLSYLSYSCHHPLAQRLPSHSSLIPCFRHTAHWTHHPLISAYCSEALAVTDPGGRAPSDLAQFHPT
jgi:hypothetical protein